METNLANKGIMWSVLGGEMVNTAFELRYMFLCSIVLISADFWWGHSESMKRYSEALLVSDSVGIEKYKWHKSRAIRRTANKLVDYVTYMLVGTFFGLAIIEPLGWGTHIYAAAAGLGIGCLAELASIIGHYFYVKFGVEVKLIDVWKFLWKLICRIAICFIKVKSKDIGKALEDANKEQK